MDPHDPYASPNAAKRVVPTPWLTGQTNFSKADEIVRSWTYSGSEALSVSNWGTAGGRGNHRWEQSGDRTSVPTSFLYPLLRRTGKSLILFVKARKYFPDRKDVRNEGVEKFTHRVFIFSVDQVGRVRFIRRIPTEMRSVVDALSDYDKFDFGARFIAIRNARLGAGAPRRHKR